MLGKSVNNQFYAHHDALAQTLYRTLYDTFDPDLNRTLRRTLEDTLRPARAAAVAQFQQDLKNAR